MDNAERNKLISELKDLFKKLKTYNKYIKPKKQLTEVQIRYRDSLREKLVYKSGVLKTKIVQLTQKQYYTLFGNIHDMWSDALNPSGYFPAKTTALGFCIDATNEAIAKLELTPLTELELPEASVAQEPKDAAEVPNFMFDKMQFHSKVIEVSKSLFIDGHYKQAILESYIALNNLVKDKSGSTLDGKALMSEIFSEKAPVIKLNDLLDRNDKDEQEGFKFLYMGAIVGVRNPKAHDNIVQSDPYRTLEYLSLVSLLMKRVDEGKVVKLRANKE